MKEVRPKQLRDREDPLGVADLFEDLLLEEGTKDRRSLGGARWTEDPATTGEATR